MFVPRFENNRELLCRDCGGQLLESREGSEEAFPLQDQYCPVCAEGVSNFFWCAHCGSSLCPRCGTPVEHVDELGIG